MGVRLDRNIPASAAPDFWRSGETNLAGSVPDGVSDTTETIHHEGRVAIQSGLGAIPATSPAGTLHPMLEVANNGRSGTDRRSIQDTIYATGNIGPGAGNWATPSSSWIAAGNGTGKAFFGHSNQTAGFALGYNTIQQVSDTLDFVLTADQGIHSRQNLRLNGGWMYDMQVLDAAAVVGDAQGFQSRWRAENGDRFIELRRKRTAGALAGGNNGWEYFFQMQRPDGAFTNHHRASWSFRNPNISTFQINPNNQLGDQLLQMWGDTTLSSSFWGLGMRGSEMTVWMTDAARVNFRVSNKGANNDQRVFAVTSFGVGDVVIDPEGGAGAGWGNGLYRFGGESSDTGIKSQRTGADGGFLNAIEFYTSTQRAFAIKANGKPARINMGIFGVPVFASNAAAVAAGLQQGDIFRDSVGGLHITF